MKELLKTRQFWRTIALMIGACLLIVILTVLSLRLLTRHGQSYIVPDFTGLTLDQISSLQDEYGFEFVVIDSIFDEGSIPGTVLRHDPAPNATVKRGRKFYVTLVSSMPDMVTMPNLIDLSLRQATALLQSTGLRVGNIVYQPHSFQNAIIDQTHRGRSIAAGEKLRKGAYVDLLVSGTQQSNQVDDDDEKEESEEEL